MKNQRTITALACLLATATFAQEPTNRVTIDPSVQRYLGEVSELARHKYFNIHTGSDNDPDVKKFLADYDVTIGRGFYGAFSYAYGQTKEVGVYPPYAEKNNTTPRKTKQYVATEHPNLHVIKWGMDPVKAGKWAAEYFNNHYKGEIPEFFEPLNEPFVHANGEIFKEATSTQDMKMLMADFYAEIGKQIDATPALKNMKVVGYASAYPSMEIKDFKHWHENMKLFIDRAGDHMDGISVHLYDGINIRGKASRRSGSNSEAILDLIESYTFLKYGHTLPHATTEYGAIDDTYGINFDERNAYRVMSSINHLLFNLLEREDNLLISIPFICDKSEWYINAKNDFQSYCAALFLPENPKDKRNTQWVYNDKVHFFDLWKDVKGDRVDFTTNNPDIQVQAFKDDQRLYIALDNLDDNSQSIELTNPNGWGKLDGVTYRSFYVDYDEGIAYKETPMKQVPNSVTLKKNETVVLAIDLAQDSPYHQRVYRTKHYANSYLQPIEANKEITFTFEALPSEKGKGVARMAIGRKLDQSKKPIVKINGCEVEMPDNWRGYDQAGRDDFFGTLEIPFDTRLLRGDKNSVSVTFPDNGGHVASMILQIEQYKEAL